MSTSNTPKFIEPDDAFDWRVCCPICGDLYTHHRLTEEFERNEEGGTSYCLRPGIDFYFPGEANPSLRRGAVRLYFKGECGHAWFIDFIQHQGVTYITWEEVKTTGILGWDLYDTPPWEDEEPAEKPNAKRSSIRPSVRFQVFKRDNFRCQYCGATSDEAKLEVDHVVPRSKGGTDNPDNLITACFDCNRGKSDSEVI